MLKMFLLAIIIPFLFYGKGHTQSMNKQLFMETDTRLHETGNDSLIIAYTNYSKDTVYFWIKRWKIAFNTPSDSNLVSFADNIDYHDQNHIFIMDNQPSLSAAQSVFRGTGTWYSDKMVESNYVKQILPNEAFTVIFEFAANGYLAKYLNKPKEKVNIQGFNAFISAYEKEIASLNMGDFYPHKQIFLRLEPTYLEGYSNHILYRVISFVPKNSPTMIKQLYTHKQFVEAKIKN